MRSLLVGIRNRNRVWIGSFNKCDIENCPQIGGMKPATCPEKAVFGTVWTEDNSQNGLQYAGGRDTGQDERTMNRTTTQWRIIYDNAL